MNYLSWIPKSIAWAWNTILDISKFVAYVGALIFIAGLLITNFGLLAKEGASWIRPYVGKNAEFHVAIYYLLFLCAVGILAIDRLYKTFNPKPPDFDSPIVYAADKAVGDKLNSRAYTESSLLFFLLAALAWFTVVPATEHWGFGLLEPPQKLAICIFFGGAGATVFHWFVSLVVAYRYHVVKEAEHWEWLQKRDSNR